MGYPSFTWFHLWFEHVKISKPGNTRLCVTFYKSKSLRSLAFLFSDELHWTQVSLLVHNFLVTGFHHVLSQSCYLFIDYPSLQVRLRPQNWYFLGSESHSLILLKSQTKLVFPAYPAKPFFNSFDSLFFQWIGLLFILFSSSVLCRIFNKDE